MNNEDRVLNALVSINLDVSDDETLAVWVKELDAAEARGREGAFKDGIAALKAGRDNADYLIDPIDILRALLADDTKEGSA